MIQIFGNNPILPKHKKYIKKPAIEVFFSDFRPKASIQNSGHREQLILNVSCKIIFCIFTKSLGKALKFLKMLRY